jgi:hypothetical protein
LPGLLPEYGEGFDHKARAPQFAVLFLLASALRKIQGDLFNATRGLQPRLPDYISMLASKFADPRAVSVRTEPKDALLSWDSFAADQLEAKVPKIVQDLFAQGRATLDELLHADFDPRRYLAEANESARATVEALARRIGLADRIPLEPALIRICWREGGDFRWPSTAVEGRQITWVFQNHPLAMWTAMLAQVILQHEYLSHLLPRSDSLSSVVREGWLMWVLEGEVANSSGVELGVLEHVRYRMDGLGSPLAFPELRAVVEVMSIKREDLYWSLTHDLLALPPGPESAEYADAVLNGLMTLVMLNLRQLRSFLDDSSLTGLESLYEAVRKRQQQT